MLIFLDMLMKIKRYKWRGSERGAAKTHNAKETPNSGATWHTKGDAIAEMYKVENKYTGSQKTPKLTVAEIEKGILDAKRHSLYYVLRVETSAAIVVFITEEFFVEMIDMLGKDAPVGICETETVCKGKTFPQFDAFDVYTCSMRLKRGWNGYDGPCIYYERVFFGESREKEDVRQVLVLMLEDDFMWLLGEYKS